MAVYGPVRHQRNIIWTSAPSPKKYYMDLSWGPYNISLVTSAEVHIIFLWWRTGPYIAIWSSVPWTICYLTSIAALISWLHTTNYNVWIFNIKIDQKHFEMINTCVFSSKVFNLKWGRIDLSRSDLGRIDLGPERPFTSVHAHLIYRKSIMFA